MLGLLMTGVLGVYLSNVSARSRIIGNLVEKRTHELADREAHLEAIVDTAVDGIITIDRVGTVKSYNTAAERMFGYSAADVIGNNVSMLMPNEYAAHHDQYLVNYLTTGVQKIIGSGREVVALRKDGSVFPMELAVSEFSTSNDGVMFTGLVRDISERKLAEDEVRRSEMRFRVMLESAADAIYLHDSNGQIIDVNSQACEMLGYSRDELLSKSVFEIDSQLGKSELTKLWKNSDKTRFPISIATKHCKRNGEIFPVEVNIGLASFAGDTLFVAIARDITERERSQEELSRANRQLYMLSQCNAAIVNSQTEEELLKKVCEIIVSTDQKKLAWAGYAKNDTNKTVEPAVHYGFDQGYLDSISITWADVPSGQGPAGLAIRTARPVVINDIHTDPRFEAWRKDGLARGYASCIGLPLVDSGKSFGVIMVYAGEKDSFNEKNTDILMQVADNASVGIQAQRSYAAMLRSRLEADKASRAKSEFLSSMSHELRTPMNAVLGFGQLLEMDLEDEQHLQNVQEILKAGKHLLTLINEILDLAKIESGSVVLSMESVMVGDVLKDCITLVKPLAEKQKIVIRNELAEDIAYKVNVDFTRFKQVILNLLSNAVKYNREGGEVVISCDVVGKRLRLSVSDTGPGMSAEQLQQLFRPFERVGAEKSSIEGTGIGLVITRNLIELMSGRIGVESREGQGSTFWVELENMSDEVSLSANKKTAELVVTENSGVASNPKIAILYIEDNPVNVRFIEKALGGGNYHIVSAPDASLGIKLAEANPPDLILMDINLPGMDGYQAIKCLKELDATCHIPVIAVSANALTRDIEKGIEAGFVKYITKPVDVKELISAIGGAVGS
ncbi:MAG: PAS domain S-box protein [Gammaproteobacteria bacterium]|nr:PAS domain S-box protein [Gammaproteobacteria bacterium]